MTEDELQAEKHVAFYAASVEAWLNTSLEYDKSIFALSAGGIGLLITLLTTTGAPSIVILTLYGLALICLVASLIMLLIIFRRNRKHIEDVLLANNVVHDIVLRRLDFAVLCLFGAGAVFTTAIGVLSAINSYETKSSEAKEKAMANEKQQKNSTMTFDSVHGLGNLTKSFNGLSSVRPQASTSTQNQTPSPASSSSSSSTPSASTSNGNGQR